MISFLLDTVLYTSVWVITSTYNGISYAINGHQETTEERLEKLLNENKEYQKEIKSLIKDLKEERDNKTIQN
jgi:hypothetical protein